MGPFGSFIFAYLLGGITFIPLVIALIFIHAYLTFPTRTTTTTTSPRSQGEDAAALAPDPLRHPDDDQYSLLKSGTDELEEKFRRTHDSDVATGYFAVCREYVPGGVNGKPPERTTPAGEVIAAESPSVYQAMYRSLFDRKQTPSIEPAKTNGKSVKRARNVFYIVLRHGHLMLYDDANQVEVRYVISLAHHDVSVYGGEEEIPEGELWIKRNAICLSRRLDSLGDLGGPTPPFYLFSENQSEKEDFYFAMLQNQSKMGGGENRIPTIQQFDVEHVVKLVQRLHSSEEQLQTRWINALLGRLFLAMYKTPELESFIANKIAKKISRVKKPNLISRIELRRIDLGDGAPLITNPRLKDLTVDGNCCVEADVQYTGNFRVEISATARIDLGQRFKAREVDIVLAVVLKKLQGHGLLRFKPPPSNRMWISFETMPQISLDVQPIVSSKQITYGIILRTIESRIREVVAESIVVPFWDDIPFLDTNSQSFRGGIWQRESPRPPQPTPEMIPDEYESLTQTPAQSKEDLSKEEDIIESLKLHEDRAMSMPVLSDTLAPKSLKARKGVKSPTLDSPTSWSTSSAIDPSHDSNVPSAMRPQSFSSIVEPVLTAHTAHVDKALLVNDTDKPEEPSDAASAMIEISARSPPASPTKPLNTSPLTTASVNTSLLHSRDPSITEPFESQTEPDSRTSSRRPSSAHTLGDSYSSESIGSRIGSSFNEKLRRRGTLDTFSRSLTPPSEDKPQGSLSIGTAAAAAKKWGLGMFAKGATVDSRSSATTRPDGTPEHPIGRGRPLPPPGTPLPPPDKTAYRRNTVLVPKRKPVPTSTSTSMPSPAPASTPATRVPPPLPERPPEPTKRPVPKPPLPKRKPIVSDSATDEILVVEAPPDSDPNSEVDTDADIPAVLPTEERVS